MESGRVRKSMKIKETEGRRFTRYGRVEKQAFRCRVVSIEKGIGAAAAVFERISSVHTLLYNKYILLSSGNSYVRCQQGFWFFYDWEADSGSREERQPQDPGRRT